MKKSKKLLMTLSLFSLMSTLSGCKKNVNSTSSNTITSNYTSTSTQPEENYYFSYFVNSDNKLTITSYSNENVENLVIPSVIDGIEVNKIDYNFKNFPNLKTVFLPKTLDYVYASAFYNCPQLTKIEVDSENKTFVVKNNCLLTYYNDGRVYLYKAWGESIEVPEDVTIIYGGAFCDSKTKEIKIGKNVTSISSASFSYYSSITSKIENIEVDSLNTTFKSEGNCLYDANSKQAIYGYKDCIIPDGVTNFFDSTFECSNVTSIYIPKSINDKNFKSNNFSYCYNLKSIKVDSENPYFTSTYDGVERNCVMSKDGTILYSGINNSDIPDSVTTIDTYAYTSKFLENFEIGKNITKINGNPFLNATPLTSITVNSENNSFDIKNDCLLSKDDSVIYSVFSDEFILPNTLKTISGKCFQNSKRRKIELPTSVVTIGDSAFENSSIEAMVIPDSVTSIGEMCFSNCSKLSELKISSSLKTISKDCFAYCNSLTEVKIPDNITSIANSGFYMCKKLAKVEISQLSNLASIGSYAFRGCNINEIFVSAKITSIYYDAFIGCPVTSIRVDPLNTIFTSQDKNGNELNKLLSKDMTKLYLFLDGDFEIPTEVNQIMNYALQFQKTKTSIDLSKTNITIIGGGNSNWGYSSGTSIQGYGTIKEIVLPDNCVKLDYGSLSLFTKVTIPSTITTLNYNSGVSIFNSSLTELNYKGTINQFKTLVKNKTNLTFILGNNSKLKSINFLESEGSSTYIQVDIDKIFESN